MLKLQAFVPALHLAQLLELGTDGLVQFDTLGHDDSFAGKLSPTRQHERMDVKGLGNIGYRNARELAQAYGGCLEMIGIAVGASGARAGHWDTPDR